MPKRITPYPLRLPSELRARLEEQAKTNHRSLNGEIITLLEAATTTRRKGARTPK